VRTASREFEEEIGYELEDPRLVTRVFTSPGRLSQRAYIYFGKVGEKTKKHFFDENERLETGFFEKKQAIKLLSSNPSSMSLLAYHLVFS
jgi:8-oxo-dGTP pyrophosphatase MutT (NUDIX family)